MQEVFFLLLLGFLQCFRFPNLRGGLEHFRIPQQSDKEVFHRDMPVHNAGDHDRRDCEAVRDLSDERGGAVEGWTLHLATSVVVDDDAGDQVHGDVATLQEGKGFGKVVWLSELGDEAEECDL